MKRGAITRNFLMDKYKLRYLLTSGKLHSIRIKLKKNSSLHSDVIVYSLFFNLLSNKTQ